MFATRRVETKTVKLTLPCGDVAEFNVDPNGIISDPGKFEGEPLSTPYFYDIMLDGFADYEDGPRYGFKLTREDRERFPHLKGKRTVWFYIRDDGFVCQE